MLRLTRLEVFWLLYQIPIWRVTAKHPCVFHLIYDRSLFRRLIELHNKLQFAMQWMVLFMKYKSSIYCSCVLFHYMWTQLLGLFVYLMIIVFSFQARKNNNPGLLRQLAKYLFFFVTWHSWLNSGLFTFSLNCYNIWEFTFKAAHFHGTTIRRFVYW